MENFNFNWKFKKEGCDKWKEVNLPHDAMIYEKRDKNCHNGKNTGYYPGGKYIYEKSFRISSEDLDKEIKVIFEGVYRNCEICLNQEHICSHNYGYTEFEVDLSGKIKPGENVLTVFVDNSLEPNSRWYSGSGIYRPVHLDIATKGAPRILKIKTRSINPALLEIRTEAGNVIEVWDGKEKVCEKKANSELTELCVKDAKLWSEKTPNLYTIVAKNEKGQIAEQFGIRILRWNASEGLTVNGERILLRGGCVHHDNGVLAACEFDDAAMRKVRIMKEAGYNALRSSHNPLSRAMLNACDTLGMYVLDEAYDGWYTPKTHHDNARTFRETWKSDLEALVKKDYHHPSVIMYSVGNEVTETAAEEGQLFCSEMCEYMHVLDETRPVTVGINIVLNLYTNKGKGVYEEKEPYLPEPLPPKTEGYVEKVTGSAFFNMMAGKLGKTFFYLSGGRKGDIVASSVANRVDVIGFNYGASRFKKDVIQYPDRLMVASETLASDLPYNWSYVKKYPAVLGDFVWTAWDYLGESGLGDWEYPSYKGLPLLAGCGTIDITGKVTAESYYQQIIWGIRKEPFIGVSPLNHWNEIPNNGSWRFTDVIDSWNWNGFEGRKAKVEVYVNAKYVRLELNGHPIKTKRVRDFKVSFNCKYEPGRLVAVALDRHKKEITRSFLETAGDNIKLSVKPERQYMTADGMSLCYIPIEFTDEKGILKPFVEELVEIEIDGPGILAGFGSALAKTNESYMGKSFKSYRGRLLAVIRSTEQRGTIHVNVKAESGLQETVSIVTK